jgi:hypothetical protein
MTPLDGDGIEARIVVTAPILGLAIQAVDLEQNPEGRLGRAALAEEIRGPVQVDVELLGELARRLGVVASALELGETPPDHVLRSSPLLDIDFRRRWQSLSPG